MRTLYLNVGECEVIKDAEIHIKIVLGSCIGLVVFHKKSRVVGGIHILLPKFKKNIKTDKITAFADTGIEHLFNLMKGYTGEIKDYKAVMAGGANIGGRSDYFDIGKENYNMCHKILKNYDIDLLFEDCLGNVSRVINFYTKDFSYEITPVNYVSYSKSMEHEYDVTSILEDIKKSTNYFPVPNKTVFEIIRLKNKEATPEKIEEIMLKDDFICVNFLRFANSSYISPKYKIKDIKQAILYVGLKNTFKFVNNLLLQNMVKKDIQSYCINLYEYKIHVLSVALISELLAEQLGITNNIPYIGGLFHDIGKVILDFYALKNYTSPKRMEIISFVENSIKSTAHGLIGRFYLQTLNLDARILDIVEYHHYPNYAAHRRLASIIALANLLISNFMIGVDNINRSKCFATIDEIIENLQIDNSILDQIIYNIPYIISIAEEMII